MFIIPKIELAGGSPARESPEFARAARAWPDMGYSRLLVVERDAMGPETLRGSFVESLVREATIEVDLAAGDDAIDRIEASLDLGVSRVVVGPRGLAELDWLASAADAFPGSL